MKIQHYFYRHPHKKSVNYFNGKNTPTKLLTVFSNDVVGLLYSHANMNFKNFSHFETLY